MALGLSVIFGVVRVVNFAHGEMMTIAMYLAIVLFAALELDPLIMMVPIAGTLFALGYAMQAGLINPFINRPEARPVHGCWSRWRSSSSTRSCSRSGRMPATCRRPISFDSFLVGPLIIDATKVYAGGTAVVVRHGAVRVLPFGAIGMAIRACADNYTGALVVGLDVKRLYALTFGLGAACVGARRSMLVLLIDVTPTLGPAYTLLAFVIVITAGSARCRARFLGGVLIGLTEALAGLLFTPSAKSMFAFAILVLVLLFRRRACWERSSRDRAASRRRSAPRPCRARRPACGSRGRAGDSQTITC